MRRLVAAGVVGAALLIVSAPAFATGPGKNGKLIYASGSGVVVADANGANPTGVVFTTSYGPVWSPDGTRFVVEQSGDIWSFDATGGDPRQLTSGPASDESPSWSPDGTQVVFGRWGNNREAIAVVGATGGPVKLLSTPAAGYFDYSPAWSPDGRRIAFHRDRNHADNSYDIWLMKPNGKSQTKWLTDPKFNGFPAWSPDSKTLVYEQKVGSKYVLRSRSVSGGAPKTLTTFNAYQPEVSPDGTRILFQTGSGAIASIKIGGGGLTVLVASGTAPSWQPLCDKTALPGGGVLTGTPKGELICGLDGPDDIRAGGGNDHVFSGAGADTLRGEGGNDVLVGGPDGDVLDGGPGKDTCVQGPGTGARTACEQ